MKRSNIETINKAASAARAECFVGKDDFAKACSQAIESGSFKRSFMFYLKGKTRRKDKRLSADAPLSLSFYDVVIDAGGRKMTMRMDHVFSFLKLEGKACDSSGEEVLGACLHHKKDRGTDVWRVVYEFEEDGSAKESNLGSIDHVLARANGGEDRLYNMQMMRCGANWNKADKEADVFYDAEASRHVLEKARAGLSHMETGNEKAKCVKAELESLFEDEIRALGTI